MKLLPDAPWRYFNQVDGAQLVPVEDITPTNPPQESIDRAKGFMAQAYRGEIDKRDPINVVREASGGFRILDGSATYLNAVEAGWKCIPVVVKDA